MWKVDLHCEAQDVLSHRISNALLYLQQSAVPTPIWGIRTAALPAPLTLSLRPREVAPPLCGH